MREDPGRAKLETRWPDVVLPAEGATLARSLSRRLMLVVHTGNAHLGTPVDRAFLRDLARARAAVRDTPGAPTPTRDRTAATVELPEVVPFRHATSHKFGVSGDAVHLTLFATGDGRRPDVEVELRMDRRLVEHLSQRRNHYRQDLIVVALAGILILASAFVATLAVA